MSEDFRIVKMSAEPKRISITLSDEEHRELFDIARRARTSVSALGHLAVAQLLVACSQGALPLLPPSTVDNAILTTVLGRELPASS